MLLQVRLKVLRKLGNITSAVTPDILNGTLLPMIIALASDQQWRIREQIIDQIPGLAEGMVSSHQLYLFVCFCLEYLVHERTRQRIAILNFSATHG